MLHNTFFTLVQLQLNGYQVHSMLLSYAQWYCDHLVCSFFIDNLEVFTWGKERRVRTKTDIPMNKFVAECEARVLSADEAEKRESRLQ